MFLGGEKKCGVLRDKQRIELEVSSEILLDRLFSADEILRLPSLAYGLKYFPQGFLVPILLIEYERYRYVDPLSSSRIALDTNICCIHANSEYISGIPPIYLNVGVLEIKGAHREMLRSLSPIANHLTKEAFSKYGRCCEAIMQPLERRL